MRPRNQRDYRVESITPSSDTENNLAVLGISYCSNNVFSFDSRCISHCSLIFLGSRSMPLFEWLHQAKFNKEGFTLNCH